MANVNRLCGYEMVIFCVDDDSAMQPQQERFENIAFQMNFCKLPTMKKETRYRILIILALLIGYVVVAVLRSGTAW